MSKRTDRRAAERAARKVAFQQLREERALKAGSPQLPQIMAPPTITAAAEIALTLQPTPEPEPPAETRLISEAQLTANRANAQLSTGAVTSEGKARSSMNALKHGLTGKTVLLPHEDAAEYERQLDSHIETDKPATDDELRLVQSIFDCIWRLNRIMRLETAVLLKGHIEFANKYEDRPALERSHLIHADAYIKYEKQLRNLNIQEARLRRTMEKDRAELTRLQSTRRHKEQAELHTKKNIEKAAPAANGFEFSAQPVPHQTTARPNQKPQRRAA